MQHARCPARPHGEGLKSGRQVPPEDNALRAQRQSPRHPTSSCSPASHAPPLRSPRQHARSPLPPQCVIGTLSRHVPNELNTLFAQRQLPRHPTSSYSPASHAPPLRSPRQHARSPCPPQRLWACAPRVVRLSTTHTTSNSHAPPGDLPSRHTPSRHISGSVMRALGAGFVPSRTLPGARAQPRHEATLARRRHRRTRSPPTGPKESSRAPAHGPGCRPVGAQCAPTGRRHSLMQSGGCRYSRRTHPPGIHRNVGRTNAALRDTVRLCRVLMIRRSAMTRRPAAPPGPPVPTFE